MSVVDHVAELQKKHAELSLKVEKEQKSPGIRLSTAGIMVVKRKPSRQHKNVDLICSLMKDDVYPAM